jgi:hypothetical protein
MSSMILSTESVKIHKCSWCGKFFIRTGEKGCGCIIKHTSCCHCEETEISADDFENIQIYLFRKDYER